MKTIDQIAMFEPEGVALVHLCQQHNQTHKLELVKANNLTVCGFISAAKSRRQMSDDAAENAAICETALQFEMLAGLL